MAHAGEHRRWTNRGRSPEHALAALWQLLVSDICWRDWSFFGSWYDWSFLGCSGYGSLLSIAEKIRVSFFYIILQIPHFIRERTFSTGVNVDAHARPGSIDKNALNPFSVSRLKLHSLFLPGKLGFFVMLSPDASWIVVRMLCVTI